MLFILMRYVSCLLCVMKTYRNNPLYLEVLCLVIGVSVINY